ncbi:cytochrome c oxidase subunit NDUFA4-like [Physella acuta]|uniref:cytochrome c oxidase subunit NDUFA4-like n=1 Tax=Physella acuta TaxID=109671 RepID=UPI0027DC0A3E|nr:cytochrome c oxidase subunit NDUFA4-like [Physella acuta]
MKGMTWKSLKEHYSLIPVYGVIVYGVTLSSFCLFRTATRNPDVAWSNKHEGTSNLKWPWNKQAKFYSPTTDYSKLSKPKDMPDL